MREEWAEDRGRDESNEHVVIGRLIRRLRVSEPPERFRTLATNVLRSSMGVEAVAWVPAESRDPVIVSGLVDEMGPSGYRDLIPNEDADTVVIPGSVNSHAMAAAGSLGWLVAVNPPGGRSFTTTEVERLHYVGALIETQHANSRTYTDLKNLMFGGIRALTAAMEARDPYTSGHSERVARIAVRIAEELAIAPPKRSDLYLAGLLHDVGKIGIEDDVLKKPGPLSDDEYRKIQGHVEIGVTILRDLRRLDHILPSVRHHHESFDGSGYPDRLAGDRIPLEARILAVADSFDAMSSHRPYRRRLSLMQIDEIFQKGRGRQWDPSIVDALFACRAEIEAIRQKGLGESLIGAVDVALERA